MRLFVRAYSIPTFTRKPHMQQEGPQREKMDLPIYASKEDSDQPAHPSILIRVLPVHQKKIGVRYPNTVQLRLIRQRGCVGFGFRWAYVSDGTFSHVADHISVERSSKIYTVFTLDIGTQCISLNMYVHFSTY